MDFSLDGHVLISEIHVQSHIAWTFVVMERSTCMVAKVLKVYDRDERKSRDVNLTVKIVGGRLQVNSSFFSICDKS